MTEDKKNIDYEAIRQRDIEEINKKYPLSHCCPDIKVGSKDDGVVIYIDKGEEMSKWLKEDADGAAFDIFLKFLQWFNNRRLHEEQHDIADALERSRETTCRDITKTKEVFELIESHLIQHALLTRIFRIIRFKEPDNDEKKGNDVMGEKNKT